MSTKVEPMDNTANSHPDMDASDAKDVSAFPYHLDAQIAAAQRRAEEWPRHEKELY